MPPATRVVNKRAVTNENDENGGATRLTRAKAAALTTNDTTKIEVTKKVTQTKRTTLAVNNTNQLRKRAALGDVSNVGKENGVAKDGKKTVAKASMVTKAAQPTKVQKVSRINSTRPALGAKDNNTSELKRPASGSGLGNATKKRVTSIAKPVVKVQEPENVVPKETVLEELSQTDEEEEKFLGKYEEVVVEAELSTAEEPLDLDKEDIDDPLMVAEYVTEIFDYLRELEVRTMANAEYMDGQTGVEWYMRGILIDWLIEVHTRFRLLPETLFLAVNIIDRFLSCQVVELDRLQLVGVTAMFIASKYEEVLSPHVQNFKHVADDGFTEEEILGAERFVLATLNYDLSYPNPMNFLRRISKADSYDIQTRTLGKYLLEMSCLDHRFIAYPPSHIAAASMYLARHVLDRGEWDATLAHYAGYTEEELQPVLRLLIDYLMQDRSRVQHEAFFRKYASKKFLKASIVFRNWAKNYYKQFGTDPIHMMTAKSTTQA